jgi:hypothetical protein
MYNYEKQPYQAQCLQWDGNNTEQVQELMGADVRLDLHEQVNVGRLLMVRTPDAGIFTMTPGWWIVKGQNGVVKCYNNETFLIKYRIIKTSETVEVDAKALRELLVALTGPSYLIREIQATMNSSITGEINPVQILLREFNAYAKNYS